MHTKNNFDFMRLFAALLVLTGHVNQYCLQGNYTFLEHNGTIGLAIFFAISGYLIPMSWERTKKTQKFLINRCLRILPALWVAVLITVFILGPITTSLPLGEYFSHKETYVYLIVNPTLTTYFYLPGVFEDYGLKGLVNGALWSIQWEFMLYILILFLGIIRLLNVYILTILYILSTIFITSLVANDDDSVTRVFCVLMFVSGSIIFYTLKKITNRNKHIITILCIILVVFSAIYDIGYFIPLAFAWLIIHFAYIKIPHICNIRKFGDYSYGIYLYHYPIIKALIYFSNGQIILINLLAMSTLLSFAFAFLSWHLIERKALKFKKNPLRNENSL